MSTNSISPATYRRLPGYLLYLKSLPESITHISATTIATAMRLGQVQVRKDLAMVCNAGRPKIGYPVDTLRDEIENHLHFRETNTAILIGWDELSPLLVKHMNASSCGINILARFSLDENDTTAMHLNDLKEFCKTNQVDLGIVAPGGDSTVDMCRALMDAGITTILNLTSTPVELPAHIRLTQSHMIESISAICKLALFQNDLEDEE